MPDGEHRAGLPLIAFPTLEAWTAWLEAEPRTSKGAWLKFAKKGSGETTLTKSEAIDGALMHGWIDGQLAGFHRDADRRGRQTAVSVESDGTEMRSIAEGRIDPLVAEDRDAGAGRLAIEDGGGGAEEGFAIDRRSGGVGFGAVRETDDRSEDDRHRADHECALTGGT